MKSKWWWGILPLVLWPALTGCSGKHLFGANDARTELAVNPYNGWVSFYDSKDNKVRVRNLKAKSGDRELSVDEMEIDNSASAALLAEVQKLTVMAEGQVEINREVMRAIDNVAAEVRRTLNPVSGVVDSLGDAAPKVGEAYHTATHKETVGPPAPDDETKPPQDGTTGATDDTAAPDNGTKPPASQPAGTALVIPPQATNIKVQYTVGGEEADPPTLGELVEAGLRSGFDDLPSSEAPPVTASTDPAGPALEEQDNDE